MIIFLDNIKAKYKVKYKQKIKMKKKRTKFRLKSFCDGVINIQSTPDCSNNFLSLGNNLLGQYYQIKNNK